MSVISRRFALAGLIAALALAIGAADVAKAAPPANTLALRNYIDDPQPAKFTLQANGDVATYKVAYHHGYDLPVSANKVRVRVKWRGQVQTTVIRFGPKSRFATVAPFLDAFGRMYLKVW